LIFFINRLLFKALKTINKFTNLLNLLKEVYIYIFERLNFQNLYIYIFKNLNHFNNKNFKASKKLLIKELNFTK